MQISTHSACTKSLWIAGFVFLFLNCSARLGVLFASCSPLIKILGLIGIILSLLVLFKPSWIKAVLFFFALTFPLYGSLPYSTHSYLFELYLSFLALMLSIKVYMEGSFQHDSKLLYKILILFVVLACGSLLLLPVRNIFWQLILWDWNIFWNAVYFSTPELSLYSIAAVNRLFLYIFFAILLSSCQRGEELFRSFFGGLFLAAFWASLVGILDFYNFINLQGFREDFIEAIGQGERLQSVFANPGWFTEFISVIIPYVLLGFLSAGLYKAKKIFLFGILILCEIAIILTYSRAGWIIYPFILTILWLLYSIASNSFNDQISWRKSVKMVMQVTVSISVLLYIGYFLIFDVFDMANTSEISENVKFKKRFNQLLVPSNRKGVWNDSLEMVKEKPLYGLGYESFKYHNSILLKERNKQWDTPHNLYLQLLVSGGVVGLAIWSLLIFAALYLLIADLVKNKAYLNIAVILSIVAFHIYGLAQAMQYIPMIWFLLFLNIGYAMTINENVLPVWIRNNQAGFFYGLFLFVIVGLAVYASDLESRGLAEKNNLTVYSLDKDQPNYLGFYPAEKWGEKGIYRWTGSDSIIRLPQGEFFELTFVCAAPGLSGDPLVVFVQEGAKEVDRIYFFQQESITKRYYIPQAKFADKKISFHVSRTWNLRKLAVANDSRNLGVAISDVKVFDNVPADGVGFYNWETWQGNPLPEKTDDQFLYRWIGQEAVFHPQQLDQGKTIYFRADQPGLSENPLMVQVWQDNELINSTSLKDTDWHGVSLQTIKKSSMPCIIKVAATWTPRAMGLGKDARTLGIAVAGLKRPNVD